MSNSIKIFKKQKTVIIFLIIILLTWQAKTAQAALLNATNLVGQLDGNGNPVYTTNARNNYGGFTPNAQGLDGPSSSVLDKVDHRLFVADYYNRRVVVFPLDTNNRIASTTAIFVLGASDFTTKGSTAVTQSTFGRSNVFNLAYDSVNKRLFVSDSSNSRVLGFSVPANVDPSSLNGENAIFVLGQLDFTSFTGGTTQNTLYYQDNLIFDPVNNRLFVVDAGNNRVMVFIIPTNADSSINGKNADYVIGQNDFNSKTTGVTQNTVNFPDGVSLDTVNNRLFLSDYLNSRILIFSVPPGENLTGKNADYVLGQNDFFTNTATTTQNGIRNPSDNLGYDPANYRYIVSDYGNNRILFYSVPPGENLTGKNAQNVLGQDDYTSTTTGVTQNRFGIHPNGQDSFDPINNVLFIKDRANNRIMEFSMIHITTTSFPDGVDRNPYSSQAIATTYAQGTSQSFSLFSGSLPNGLSLDPVTGSISGTPTAPGAYTFTVEADDNFSTGPFFDRFAYTITIASNKTSSGSVPIYGCKDPNASNYNYFSASNPSLCKYETTSIATEPNITEPTITEPTITEPTITEPTITEPTNINKNNITNICSFTKTLRKKSIGPDVLCLQKFLNFHDYILSSTGSGSPGKETSYFGTLTLKAVKAFQKANNLTPDGIVGPLTRAVINKQ